MRAPTWSPSVVRFGLFELDVRSGELRKSGVRVTLQDQPLKLLECLLERPGELVTRDELRGRLWPGDTFVDFDQGMNAAVRRLREALVGLRRRRRDSSRPCRGAAIASSRPSRVTDRPFTTTPNLRHLSRRRGQAVPAGSVGLVLWPRSGWRAS